MSNRPSTCWSGHIAPLGTFISRDKRHASKETKIFHLCPSFFVIIIIVIFLSRDSREPKTVATHRITERTKNIRSERLNVLVYIFTSQLRDMKIFANSRSLTLNFWRKFIFFYTNWRFIYFSYIFCVIFENFIFIFENVDFWVNYVAIPFWLVHDSYLKIKMTPNRERRGLEQLFRLFRFVFFFFWHGKSGV